MDTRRERCQRPLPPLVPPSRLPLQLSVYHAPDSNGLIPPRRYSLIRILRWPILQLIRTVGKRYSFAGDFIHRETPFACIGLIATHPPGPHQANDQASFLANTSPPACISRDNDPPSSSVQCSGWRAGADGLPDGPARYPGQPTKRDCNAKRLGQKPAGAALVCVHSICGFGPADSPAARSHQPRRRHPRRPPRTSSEDPGDQPSGSTWRWQRIPPGKRNEELLSPSATAPHARTQHGLARAAGTPFRSSRPLPPRALVSRWRFHPAAPGRRSSRRLRVAGSRWTDGRTFAGSGGSRASGGPRTENAAHAEGDASRVCSTLDHHGTWRR